MQHQGRRETSREGAAGIEWHGLYFSLRLFASHLVPCMLLCFELMKDGKALVRGTQQDVKPAIEALA